VTDSRGYRHRYFYISPLVDLNQEVTSSTILGKVQDLRVRYSGITPHVHLEIIDNQGKYLNPDEA
jgi:hypothetical protein